MIYTSTQMNELPVTLKILATQELISFNKKSTPMIIFISNVSRLFMHSALLTANLVKPSMYQYSAYKNKDEDVFYKSSKNDNLGIAETFRRRLKLQPILLFSVFSNQSFCTVAT